ncbi:MAG: hypothetical protein ACYCW6_19330 [Candidatus Xenobia bacterium]
MNPGDTLHGRYRIERTLGRGGMGGVYLATHLELEVAVAVKEMVVRLHDAREQAEVVRRVELEPAPFESDHPTEELIVTPVEEVAPPPALEQEPAFRLSGDTRDLQPEPVVEAPPLQPAEALLQATPTRKVIRRKGPGPVLALLALLVIAALLVWFRSIAHAGVPW